MSSINVQKILGNVEVGTANLFVDTSTSNIGIGTNTPAHTLDVIGDINLTGNMYSDNTIINLPNLSNLLKTNNAIAIGSSAGQALQGSHSVAIGTSAGQGVQGINAVAIGNGAGQSAQGSYSVAIGSSAGQTSQGSSTIVINATGSQLDTTTSSATYIKPIRSVGLASNVLAYENTSGEVFSHSGTSINAAGTISTVSDRRLKTNINIIENALDKVCALNGYTFKVNDTPSSGLIAQEVKEVLPELVSGSEETRYSLAYGNLMGLIIEAIKELKQKIG
jgi:hypothetical protein